MSENFEQRISVLERQVLALRRDYQKQQEWLDTVNSHWVKRIWWFFCGFRYHRLGRWYQKDRSW